MRWTKVATEASRAMVRGRRSASPVPAGRRARSGGRRTPMWRGPGDRLGPPRWRPGTGRWSPPPGARARQLSAFRVLCRAKSACSPWSPPAGRAALLQVCLGLRGLVADLQLGGDVAGDDLGGEPPPGVLCLPRMTALRLTTRETRFATGHGGGSLAPRRAQIWRAATGSSTERSPLSSDSKPTPALASGRLTLSWPLAQRHSG